MLNSVNTQSTAILDDLFIYLSIENRDAKTKCILSTQLLDGMWPQFMIVVPINKRMLCCLILVIIEVIEDKKKTRALDV